MCDGLGKFDGCKWKCADFKFASFCLQDELKLRRGFFVGMMPCHVQKYGRILRERKDYVFG